VAVETMQKQVIGRCDLIADSFLVIVTYPHHIRLGSLWHRLASHGFAWS